MKRLVVLAVLAALVAVAASTALGRNTRPNAPAVCAKGAVAARVGGKAVCLHAGMACKAAYNRIYKKHGFTCVAGHLRKSTKAKPPAPTPTPPDPPYTPPTGPVGTANTTVAVGMFDDPKTIFVLSPPTFPSGNVTFVITSSCVGACSFDLEGVHAGRTLDPGQTDTWTVALAPGTYRFHCDVFPEGMKGTFTVTP
jgi:Cupredoxin-like domain